MHILEKLNIVPSDMNLFITALTHTSYTNEHENCPSYERLEFLGDAILEAIISDYLYKEEKYEEGSMTKIRASYVCERALYEYAKDLDLPLDMRLGSGEHGHDNQTIIADMFEAFIGALYLDKGYDYTKKIVLDIIVPYIDKKMEFLKDYKTILQESVQTVKKSVIYEIIDEQGPAHNRMFTAQVKVDNIIMGKGIASSKKQAEQLAAKEALSRKAKI